MDINNAIKNLKKYINSSYEETCKKIGPNILRGHLRVLSTDIEDGIALFISNLMPNHKVFLDSSIYINGKNNRPDLLVVNEDNEVVAMVEIKANMGWCRNAKNVIDDIVSNDDKFQRETELICVFSREDSQIVKYKNNVKLFLIAFTDGNCSKQKHQLNKAYAKTTNVKQFNLFSGWYDSLDDCEVDEFANELLN